MSKEQMPGILPAISYACFGKDNRHGAIPGYLELIENEIANGDRQNLFNIDKDDLQAGDALLSVASTLHTQTIVSGCHAVVDGIGTIHLQGMITHPRYRQLGIAKITFANLIVAAASSFQSTGFSLIVREVDEAPATAPFHLYERFGFRVTQRKRVHISGSYCDRHIISADGNSSFVVVIMEAGIAALNIAKQNASIFEEAAYERIS